MACIVMETQFEFQCRCAGSEAKFDASLPFMAAGGSVTGEMMAGWAAIIW